MNLLTEPWMPVRKRDGSREWVPPNRLADPDILAFDADRADFNGALAQFAIGLFQTTTPVDNSIEWRQLFNGPPDAAVLDEWFAPVAIAFEFDGDGARFMQDMELKPKVRTSENGEDIGDFEGVQQLLVDCAGEGEKVKDNTDLFVKRKHPDFGLCECCSAAALYALQSGAPGGGRGYLTSIRGGGPLTTLVVCDGQAQLWHSLWLNVIERSKFLDHSGNRHLVGQHFVFPWMADIRVLQTAGIGAAQFEGENGKPKPTEDEKPRVTPAQVHPSHLYWGMPRRIRLDLSGQAPGVCGTCGRAFRRLVRQYVTKNYGLSYKGPWDHPLSPYYEAKDGWRPLHPQPDGLGYRHWLAWVLGQSSKGKKQRRARVVEHFLQGRTRTIPGALRLWAFGYDMSNMKARCWYESTLPLYGLADCEPTTQKEVESEIANWLGAAVCASKELSLAVKSAWFSESATKKWKADQSRDFAAKVTAQLWSRTEHQFYAQLSHLIEVLRNGATPDRLRYREEWHSLLAKVALSLFSDEIVGAGQIERQNPRRAAAAYQRLKRSEDGKQGLYGSELRQALGLSAGPASTKAAGKLKRRADTSAVSQ